MTEKMFAAFFSYVHDDDKRDNGRLTKLREMLEEEVRALSGEEFEIFQDYEDIHWGQKWEERINRALDDSTFLIPVVTPRYIRKEFCRKELLQFLERENALSRNDLVLSLYYIDTDLSARDDPVAVALANHQYFDWRDLRHEPSTNPEVGKRIEKMAREIIAAMKRSTNQGTKISLPSQKHQTLQSAVSQTATSKTSSQTRQPDERIEPPTVVVDPMPRRGDYTSIQKALESSEPGTRILIRPGFYREALVLNRPFELIGDGERSEIVIEAINADTLLFQTEFGRVSNLTLRQASRDKFFGVNISRGRLELEDCDITSQSLSCVFIHEGADPRLRRNHIHDGKECGVLVWTHGQGTFEDNDIFNNNFSGVEIRTEGNPLFRRNRIHDGKQVGVMVHEDGRGTFEENDIFNNTLAGVEIKTGGDSLFRRNRIHDGKQSGVMVHENGKGTFEENNIFNNSLSGAEIKMGGDPLFRRNDIHDGKEAGVLVWDGGKGTFEDNDIFNNNFSGVEIRTEGDPVLRQNRIRDGKENGVMVHENGKGTFEENDIFNNALAGVEIKTGGNPLFRRNRINNNNTGVYAHDNAGGTLLNNEITANILTWNLDESSKTRVKALNNIEN